MRNRYLEKQSKFLIDRAKKNGSRLTSSESILYIDHKVNGLSKRLEGQDAKKMLEEGGIALLRAFRGLPRNKALIKFLSEPGIKAHLQKTENFYMQEQGKHMKK